MRSLKLIRDSGRKAGSSEDAKTTKIAKEDDYKCTQRIERALTRTAKDYWHLLLHTQRCFRRSTTIIIIYMMIGKRILWLTTVVEYQIVASNEYDNRRKTHRDKLVLCGCTYLGCIKINTNLRTTNNCTTGDGLLQDAKPVRDRLPNDKRTLNMVWTYIRGWSGGPIRWT